MRQLKEQLIWLFISVALFSGYAFLTHVYKVTNTEKTLIIIDTSFDMTSKKDVIQSLINELTKSKYRQYQLLSEKVVLQSGWNQTIMFPNTTFYGTRNLDFLKKYENQIDQADHKLLITNADQSQLKQFRDWRIVRP